MANQDEEKDCGFHGPILPSYGGRFHSDGGHHSRHQDPNHFSFSVSIDPFPHGIAVAKMRRWYASMRCVDVFDGITDGKPIGKSQLLAFDVTQ